jgi:hypothetical protein
MNTRSPRTAPRLNLWDFDDTLAHSERAVSELRNATTPEWMWWHDAALSRVATSRTAPITSMWLKLLATPGKHAILTGRNGASVEAWLADHTDHPVIGEAVKAITVVISTSGANVKHIDVAVKKATIIAGFISEGHTVHLFDDRKLNLTEAAKVGAKVHHVQAR